MILDLLFPKRCVGCGKEGEWICNDCVRILSESGALEEVSPGVWACYSLEERIVREALHNLKYNGVEEVARCLVLSLSRWARPGDFYDRFGREAVLVPVPTSKARLKQRGYNQAEMLAQALGAWLGWRVELGVLRKVTSGTLVGRGAAERLRRAEKMFELGRSFESDAQLVVLDDVRTSGATLAACMQLLEREGCHVNGLVMAQKHL